MWDGFADIVQHVQQILYAVHCEWHPGTQGDRLQVLEGIRAPSGVNTSASAARFALNQWKVQCTRALELGIALPEVIERYRALKAIVGPVLMANPEVYFRLQMLELQNGVPHQYTEEALLKLLVFSEGELQDLCSAPRAPRGESQVRLSNGPGQGGRSPSAGDKRTKGQKNKDQKNKDQRQRENSRQRAKGR